MEMRLKTVEAKLKWAEMRLKSSKKDREAATNYRKSKDKTEYWLVPVGLSVRVLVVVSPVVSACNSVKVNSAAAAPPPSAAATAPATPSRPTIATPRYVR